jgi:hypothetical protein
MMPEKIYPSINKILFIALISAVNFNIAACSANDAKVVEITTTSQSTASETETSQAIEETSDEQSPTGETGSEKSTKKLLGDRGLNFIDAVKSGEEYKNGTKSDIYFIISESHTNWKNLQVVSVKITSASSAEVKIRGDRKAEGIDYTGDEITFCFVLENDEWKIDFSQK